MRQVTEWFHFLKGDSQFCKVFSSWNSFGDGRFEIGNVNEQVRAGIDITCPKTRIGMCEFMSFGNTEVKYPTLKNELTY
jgi:hypothetical protein